MQARWCVYIYIYIHIHMYLYVYVCVYIYIYICLHPRLAEGLLTATRVCKASARSGSIRYDSQTPSPHINQCRQSEHILEKGIPKKGNPLYREISYTGGSPL